MALKDKAYEKELDKAIDELFGLSDDMGWTWPRLAFEAGLSYGTIYNLGYYITRRPQDRTMRRLAKAVGMRWTLVRDKKLKISRAS